MGYYAVPSLKSLAFMVSYKDMFTNLALCRDYEGKENHEDEVSNPESPPFYASLDGTISYIRARLSQHLVGVMSDEIRKMYVKMFYGALREFRNEVLSKKFRKKYWQSFYESNAFDVSVFLDCVLDDNFEELEIDAVLPYLDPDPKLIATIANRSCYLEKLKRDFSLMNAKLSSPRLTDEKLNQLILGLSSLENLTSLSLHGLSGGVHKTLYKSVAISCPAISHLSIVAGSGNYIKKVDVLSLILIGELVDEMFQGNYNEETEWSVDETLQRLRVPPEYLTPLCSTLQHLQLGDCDYYGRLDCTFAFVLRHVPLLQNLDVKVRDSSTSVAVKIFHDTSGMEKLKIQADFENLCRNIKCKISLEKNSLLSLASETLALTTLKCVDLTDKNLLSIIGKSCPFLKDVLFDGAVFFDNVFCWSKSSLDEHLNDSLDGLESILSSWPKLESATLKFISSQQHLEILLKVFGPNLLHLTLDNIKDKVVNLEHLQPCSKLESLRFRGYQPNTSTSSSKAAQFQWKQFLPQLKSVESDVCLDSIWSRVFEEKSTLTSVNLNCFHIGTDASNQADWGCIPKMWPHLETLKIPQSKNLTLAIVDDLVTQLSSLKSIHLPQKMRCIAEGMKECYESPTSPIHFDARSDNHRLCRFLPVEKASYNKPGGVEEEEMFEDDERRPDYYDDDNSDNDDDYEDPSHYLYYDNDRLSYGSDPGAWEF